MHPGFQGRLALFSGALAVATLVLTLIGASLVAGDVVAERVREELRLDARLLTELMKTRQAQLESAGRVLADDFALREAVATGDGATIRAMLENHGARINADVAIALNRDGQRLAATETAAAPEGPLLPDRLVQGLKEGESLDMLAQLGDGEIYQIVVAPVRAPLPVGWVCLGFRINTELAEHFSDLLGPEVSFLRVRGTELRVLASSRNTFDGIDSRAFDPAEPSFLPNERFLRLSVPLPSAGEARLFALFEIDRAQAMAGFHLLQARVLLFSVVVVLIAVVAARLMARTVIRPLRTLAEAAERIAEGDFSHPVALRRRDEIGSLALAFNRMQAALSEREAHIRHQAYHDSLTGLPNRVFAELRLEGMVSQARAKDTPVAVLSMDVDRFRTINDMHGYGAGDTVLRQVADRLSEVAENGALAARLGADEFILLVPGIGVAAARHLAEVITHSVSRPIALETGETSISVSIGVAVCPQHGDTGGMLLRRADIALYDAKEAGEAFCVYTPGRDERHLRRLELSADLRRAADNGELELLLQPREIVSEPDVRAAEALLRWRHPDHGELSPTEFIPLAEEARFIGFLTDWVLDAGIRLMAASNDEESPLHLSINLSPLDLDDPGLAGRIGDRLSAADVEPGRLTLEVTESTVVGRGSRALRALAELRRRGLRVAIDDFGVGHSSLAQLLRMPVDELKIDKTFVIDMAQSDQHALIVESIIDLGHRMGLDVVAEGVSHEVTRERLLAFGCDTLQGYLIGRAMPPVDFAVWWSERRTVMLHTY